MSGNSLDDKNDFNYQQELSRFLHTGCNKLTGCRIMIVEKPNLILEAHLWEISRGDVTFFTPMSRFPHFRRFMSI